MSRRALVCSYSPPQPDRDSGSQRIWDLMQVLLAEGWRVTFVASQGLGEARYVRQLQQRGIAVIEGAALEKLLAEVSFDLTLFAFWPVAELYMPIVRRVSPATRVIVDSLDLHFLRTARRSFGNPGGLLDAGYGSQACGELNTYAAADAVLTVSQKESELLAEFVGDSLLVRTVPDGEAIALSPHAFAQRRGIVMVASYHHPPNVQAVEYLCGEVLPRVPRALLAQHPVCLVGSGLNETVRSYARGLPAVRAVGWVPEVAPYLHRARISVVPLRYGAGTKRKMIQALMAGTPTVTTSIGAEGLGLRDREHALISDEPGAFADAIAELLRDETLWKKVQRQGRAEIMRSRSMDEVRARFLDVLAAVLAAPAKAALLPEITTEDYSARLMYEYWHQLEPHLRSLLDKCVPRGAEIVLASDRCPVEVRIKGYTTRHFTEDADERRSRWRDADSTTLINRLETWRQNGAQFLFIPNPSLWWLEQRPEFREHLESRCQQIAAREGFGVLYRLAAEEIASVAASGDRDEAGHFQNECAAAGPVIGGAGDVRLIAFYLPQFHPIPENDAWWGEGFTEWRNVVQAQPLFPGHDQPQLPADLGYYDLRAAETRAEQARLARQYGIGGFCYYHYWFGGKRLLERPFSEVLASGEPDFPFCLCWANEPWSRQWDGRPHDVLQPQIYSEEDDLAHIHALLPALRDPRAILVGGRPLFLVYQGRELPDPARTIATWRREVESAGLPGIYLLAVESGWDAGWDATLVGFDAKVLFQPQFSLLRETPRTEVAGSPELHVFDYEKAWPALAHPEPVPYRRYDTVFPAWDNTARKGERGWVVHNSTPAAYEEWLRLTVARASKLPPGERLVFVNAWNEWAEGAHLEPDQRHGRAYLEATRRALAAAQPQAPAARGKRGKSKPAVR